ncbi:Chemotaxis response regulator protein-glutamate methylesterase of group 2 operon [Fundidesulfovibrio magnetotacticus]|uniref:protein-glutamate methylesterase n=1 Tax=Fundidesulfovibrio magnetotacticus TaxID=2730080 RepID=A0A6V8LQ47_9BACT|nr:CheB methylesterase domain-containing protein [Fundidesulfovibrio magnetotacticus]GFK93100.1 Chemotaxis response regulator protein-glutamate methylesterase of group 2 operon [Fundidesulfovibrio magnetotacticus]
MTARRYPPILAVGASTGGPKAVADLLAGLPAGFPGAVLVAQHLDDAFSDNLADWLGLQSGLPVTLAREGDRLLPGRVYVARGGHHLVVNAVNTLSYSDEPAACAYRPCIDALFESLAASALRPGVAVLLTGMGADGAKGLLALRGKGWLTIAQDRASSTVYGMPKAARDLGAASLVLPLSAIAAQAAKHLPRT